MEVIFWEDDSSIKHQYVEFYIGDIEYIMDFTMDESFILPAIESDPEIYEILHQRQVCSVKFVVSEYYKNECADNLYSAPQNHNFGKQEIRLLKQTLESLLKKHSDYFKPECYFFMAERDSLTRMYKKMCDRPSSFMLGFQPLPCLGESKNYFVIKTPNWRK